MKYTSNAQWPSGLLPAPFGDVTSDKHEDKPRAEGVCRMLETDGISLHGNDKRAYPLRTWVEEVKD